MTYTVHNCEQRTPEWDALRAGKITASIASKLVTPTGKPSVQYKKEIGRIIAEAMGWQDPEPNYQSYWMERGIVLEDTARGWLQVETGEVVHQCGFIEHESGLAGFSPDGYIMRGDDLMPVELKCPKPSTHIAWLIDGGVPAEHLPQCHFALAITGAPEMPFMSYNPNTTCPLFMVKRNDMTKLMDERIHMFIDALSAAWETVTGEPYSKSKGENE